MSLFADRIREAARNKSTVPFQPTGGSITEQIQAQQTGKDSGAGIPTGQSNIGAQTVASVPNQLGAQAQAGAEQMAAEERQAGIKQAGITADVRSQQLQHEAQMTRQTQDMLANAVASDKELDSRQDAASLENAAAALRIQDKEYMSKIEQIAKEKNYTNEIVFNEAMKHELIGKNLTSTLEKIRFSEAQADRRRAANMEEALQDLARANAIMNAQIKDQRTGMIIGAAADAAKTGISYGSDAGWFKSGDAVETAPLKYQGPATESTSSGIDIKRGAR